LRGAQRRSNLPNAEIATPRRYGGARNDNSGFVLRRVAVLVFFSLLFTLPASRLWASSQITHTSKTDWQSGVLVNATWYPETQLQLDWQGSSFTTPGHSPSEMWLAGWKYRRKITINNSLAYGLSDYQVWIPTSAFGSAWTLIRSSAQSTMADFRFTPSTATTTVPYWIDDNTTTPKGFWVKISTLPAGNNTIYMYYGNASASVAQSGDNTFEFFDDFLGSSLDASKWTATGTGISVADGILTISVPSPSWGHHVVSNSTFSNNKIIETKGTMNTGATGTIELMVGYGDWGTDTVTWSIGGEISTADAQQWQARYNVYNSATGTAISAVSMTYNTYDILSMAVLPSAAYFYKNGTYFASSSVNSINNKKITIANTAQDAKVDWIRIRHYAPTEPTISSVSSEEGAFFSTGTYRSAVIDTASKIVVSSVSWNPSSQPAGTNIAVGIRVSSYPFSINSSTPSWLTVSNGQTLNWHGRYIQYQSTFTTTNSTTTPRLEDISITYRVKPWQEKSVTRTNPNSYGFGGGENWIWQVPVKSGSALTITAYIRYNTEYGGSTTKPKLTLSGAGISPTSISATSSAENAWELLTINPGTPSQNATLTLRAEGFSTSSAAKFYIDDINVSQ